MRNERELAPKSAAMTGLEVALWAGLLGAILAVLGTVWVMLGFSWVLP